MKNLKCPQKNLEFMFNSFQQIKKIYIGEAKNVVSEIRTYLTPFQISNNPYKKAYIDRSGLANIKSLKVILSPNLNLQDSKVRKSEEKRLIAEAGPNCINIMSSKYNKKTIYMGSKGVIEPIFKKRIGDWRTYQTSKYLKPILPYPNLPEKPSESCIYVIVHRKTGNFYIGETGEENLAERLRKHKSVLRKTQYYLEKGIKLSQFSAYGRMVKDMQSEGPEFEYSVIEYLDELTRSDRKKREDQVVADAIYRFKSRVYNRPVKRAKDILDALNKNILIPVPSDPLNVRNIEIKRVPKNQQKKLPGRIFYPVIVNNVWYSQVNEAAKALALNPKTLSWRLKSPTFPNYISLKNIDSKKFPTFQKIKKKPKTFSIK
uniref:GIY-YIG homing endonuclease n=1 Tax=Dunaliella salina TaxID=3046 RepID=D0FXY1_DUNSA|nr:GIY-YIG homing endonuclease [Dunaliella salina]ACS95064.1 GIY-YIG homing endonuclease [Dunaliella salina]